MLVNIINRRFGSLLPTNMWGIGLGIVFGLLTLLGSEIKAQDQKMGYIDSDYILNNLPEYEGVEKRLNVLAEQWQKELDKMNQEIEELRKEYEAKEILFTDEVREERKKEIQAKIEERDSFKKQKFGPEGDYFSKQKELLNPIQRKVMKAVTTVAEREGYDYVFDRSGKMRFMYTKAEWDLSDEVLLEMGIETNEQN